MSTDEYRRGTAVERERQRKQRPARGRYRGVLPVIYAIGFVMFTVVSLYIGRNRRSRSTSSPTSSTRG